MLEYPEDNPAERQERIRKRAAWGKERAARQKVREKNSAQSKAAWAKRRATAQKGQNL